MYYDDSNKQEEENNNWIRYFDWMYYYDESNKHNEENKQLNTVLLLFEYIALDIQCNINKEENQQPIRTTKRQWYIVVLLQNKNKNNKGYESDQPRESQVKDHTTN